MAEPHRAPFYLFRKCRKSCHLPEEMTKTPEDGEREINLEWAAVIK